jgi:hypothetical protein
MRRVRWTGRICRFTGWLGLEFIPPIGLAMRAAMTGISANDDGFRCAQPILRATRCSHRLQQFVEAAIKSFLLGHLTISLPTERRLDRKRFCTAQTI